MNSGGFSVSTPQTGFSFGTPSSLSQAAINPLGSMFTSQSGALGVGSTFGVPAPAPVGSSMFGSVTTTPSLFGGTNTTASTGTTPSTGIFSGLTNTAGGIRPLVFPSATNTPNTMFGMTTPSLAAPSFTGGQTNFLGQSSFPTLGMTPNMTSMPTSLLPAAPSNPIGLGGVDFSQTSTGGVPGGSTVAGKSDSKTIKEQSLPNEISESINVFRKYVKDQKVIREEISRVSSKPICKVQEETNALKQLLCSLSSGLQRNCLTIEKLKMASAQDLKHAEIAQRTKDLPPSLQFENTAPTIYFQELVFGFEKQMCACRQQIEQLEQHFASLSQPFILSPQELNVIVRRLHETFVALAAQLQTVHDAVRMQKESFLGLRRSVVGEDKDIFQKKRPQTNNSSSSSMGGRGSGGGRREASVPVTLGPAPFSSYPSAASMVMANALNRTQQTPGTVGGGYVGMGGVGSSGGHPQSSFSSFAGSSAINNPLGYPGGVGGTVGGGGAAFGNPTAFGAVENKTFQLQKPPGNKRGKRWTTN